METNYPHHLPGFDYIGPHRYSLTFCTHARARHFEDPSNVELVLLHLLRTAVEQAFEIIAYCFMPDHVHIVMQGTAENSDLKEFIKRMKQFSGFYFKKKSGKQLWQRYGYEHVIRNEESTRKVVRYVLENPLRQGLVKSVGDYAFIGSSRYSREELMDYVREESEDPAMNDWYV